MNEYSAENENFGSLPANINLLAGVMGWPVAHSLSPRLHGFWLKQYAIKGAYLPLAVSPQDFGQALRALPRLGFKGVNVTLPHKEAAFKAVDEVDDFARRVGAVNTLILRPDGKLLGLNTDGFGFIQNLKQAAPRWRATAGPVLLLGAGGAARGIIVALLDEGVPELFIMNRTQSRADELVAALADPRLKVLPWGMDAGALRHIRLLVNSTSLGMSGAGRLDFDLSGLARDAVVYDIVYTPPKTPLLLAAEARGHVIVGGLGMLLYQAQPGFEAWFGRKPEVSEALKQHMAIG